MSTLLERGSPRGPADDEPAEAGPSPVLTGLLAAAQAATASLVVVLVPVVLAWAVVPGDRSGWARAVRVGADVWLLAHHAGIAVPGGHVGLLPLGLLLVPLLACWFAGARLARALDPRAEAIRAGVGRARPVLPPWSATAALVLGYAAIATAAALMAGDEARPVVWQACAGSAAVAAAGGAAGIAAWRAGGVLAGLRLLLAAARVPEPARAWLRPAAVAVAVQLAAGLVLFVVALVAGWDRVAALHGALAPGPWGGAVLVLGQLLLLPNAVVWCAAVAAGPGFALGTGTSVDPGGTVLGPLPALPALGALPVPGPHPGAAWALLAVPVLAGVVAGALLVRASPGCSGRLHALDAAGTGALAGLLLGALGWLSGGPAGPGRLAVAGPSPWLLALAAAAEVAAGALLAVGATLLLRSLSAAKIADARSSSPRTEG